MRGLCYLWDRVNPGRGCDSKNKNWLDEVVRVAQSQ